MHCHHPSSLIAPLRLEGLDWTFFFSIAFLPSPISEGNSGRSMRTWRRRAASSPHASKAAVLMLSSRTSISLTFEELGGEGMEGLSKHFRLITASTAKIHQNSTAPFFLIRQLSSSIFTSTSSDIYIAMPVEHQVILTLPRGVHLAEDILHIMGSTDHGYYCTMWQRAGHRITWLSAVRDRKRGAVGLPPGKGIKRQRWSWQNLVQQLSHPNHNALTSRSPILSTWHLIFQFSKKCIGAP